MTRITRHVACASRVSKVADAGNMVTGLQRHIQAAHALRLPGAYRPLRLGTALIGYVTPAVAARLLRGPCVARGTDIVVADAAALAACVAALAADGVFRPRGEAFDVRATPESAVLAQVDRGALPCLGIAAAGVHVNGLVRGADGWRVWVARRAATKALDPGKLDHLVAGGICAGMDALGTLEKEAAEEAGVPPALARQARFAGVISYAMARPEGLRRDTLYCYDLELPADFQPEARDGEVAGFALLPIGEVLALVSDTDQFKFNVNLVLIALFERMQARKGVLF